MPDKKAFYGFGNYLTDGGSTLGSLIVFVLTDDEPAARARLIQELSKEGDLVPGSLQVYAGNTVPSTWLMAAAMESKGAAWSSGTTPTPKIATIQKREYLS